MCKIQDGVHKWKLRNECILSCKTHVDNQTMILLGIYIQLSSDVSNEEFYVDMLAKTSYLNESVNIISNYF